MKISYLGEFGLIDSIRKMAGRSPKGVRVGIGDDAAALLHSPSSMLLATTDMLLDGVHFDLRTTDLYSLGWKSAAVNLSDIAAMGGTPRFCLTALGIPPSLSVEDISEFYRGFHTCLKNFGTVLVGGDTCRSRTGLVISVTVLGEVKKKQAVTRSGARAGDLIFVTGTLGDSAAGLELLRAGARRQKPVIMSLIEKHLRPMPRVVEGGKIAAAGIASAMIDVSDGLSSDLGHICEQSKVGADILAEMIPLSKNVLSLKTLQQPALEYALSGGEDYELLFTAPREKAGRLRSLRLSVTEIGRIVKGSGMRLLDKDGRRMPLTATGYDHFRPAATRRGVPR